MPRFYFDIRDDAQFTPDETGVDLAGEHLATDEAAITLAALAKRLVRGPLRRQLSVEVRDETKEPAFAARLTFEPLRAC